MAVPAEVPLPLISKPKNGKLKREEEKLYEPILAALKTKFEQLGDCYIEDTSKGNFSEALKRILDDSALYILKVEKFSPDLTGYLMRKNSTSKEIITVEIKPDKIRIKDISKAKLYADVLNAKFAFVISPKSIEEVFRRFVKGRPSIIYRSSSEPVIIAKFDVHAKDFSIDRQLYSNPREPFTNLAGYCDQCGRWFDFLVKSDYYKYLCKDCYAKESAEKKQ